MARRKSRWIGQGTTLLSRIRNLFQKKVESSRKLKLSDVSQGPKTQDDSAGAAGRAIQRLLDRKTK
jgi:hypothetical protein